MNRSYKTWGIVLGRKNFGEADKLLTIYTKHHGKKTLIAKGVRRITSRRAPYIELFSHISLMIYRGKTIDILTEVVPIDQFSLLRKRLGRIGHAYVAAELIDKLTPDNESQEDIYDLSLEFFTQLNNPKITRDQAKQQLEEFKIRLLSLLGFIDIEQKGQYKSIDQLIENILEKKIKSHALLPHMY